MIVMIYKFEGCYSGRSEYEYHAPEPGETHRCLLFLAQDGETEDYPRARSECEKYGFAKIVFSGHDKLEIGALNSDSLRGFAGYYDEAIRAGSSLAYYPNA